MRGDSEVNIARVARHDEEEGRLRQADKAEQKQEQTDSEVVDRDGSCISTYMCLPH